MLTKVYLFCWKLRFSFLYFVSSEAFVFVMVQKSKDTIGKIWTVLQRGKKSSTKIPIRNLIRSAIFYWQIHFRFSLPQNFLSELINLGCINTIHVSPFSNPKVLRIFCSKKKPWPLSRSNSISESRKWKKMTIQNKYEKGNTRDAVPIKNLSIDSWIPRKIFCFFRQTYVFLRLHRVPREQYLNWFFFSDTNNMPMIEFAGK